MSPNAASGTAIERARLAYDEMKRRQHGAELQRRARERSRNITLAAIVVAALVLVAGVAIYKGGTPDSLGATTQDVRGDKTRTSQARTGQVRSYVKGNTCRELQFNNDSGTFVAGNLVACDPNEAKRDTKQAQPQSPPKPSGVRINSIRDGFAR